jgi:hypothetical protein
MGRNAFAIPLIIGLFHAACNRENERGNCYAEVFCRIGITATTCDRLAAVIIL